MAAATATRSRANLSPGEFMSAVLKQLGLPDTASNRKLLTAWAGKGENTKARWNPLATTLHMPGAIAFNTLSGGGHVWSYATPEIGVKATADTLKGYASIVAFLAADNAAGVFSNPGARAEFAKWSGNTSNPAGAAGYIARVQSGFASSGGSWFSGLQDTIKEGAGNVAMGTANVLTGGAAGKIKDAADAAAKLGKADTWVSIGLYAGGFLLGAALVWVGLTRSLGASSSPAAYAGLAATKGAV